jgi:hypothetical protein
MASMGETGSLLVSANNRHIVGYSLCSAFPGEDQEQSDKNVIFYQSNQVGNNKFEEKNRLPARHGPGREHEQNRGQNRLLRMGKVAQPAGKCLFGLGVFPGFWEYIL